MPDPPPTHTPVQVWARAGRCLSWQHLGWVSVGAGDTLWGLFHWGVWDIGVSRLVGQASYGLARTLPRPSAPSPPLAPPRTLVPSNPLLFLHLPPCSPALNPSLSPQAPWLTAGQAPVTILFAHSIPADSSVPLIVLGTLLELRLKGAGWRLKINK